MQAGYGVIARSTKVSCATCSPSLKPNSKRGMVTRFENHMVCTWKIQLISWRNWILSVLHNQHHRTWPISFFYTLVQHLPSIHPASFRKLLCQELRGQEFQRDSLLSACKEVNKGPRGGMESQVRRVLMFSLPEWLSKTKMGVALPCIMQVIWYDYDSKSGCGKEGTEDWS